MVSSFLTNQENMYKIIDLDGPRRLVGLERSASCWTDNGSIICKHFDVQVNNRTKVIDKRVNNCCIPCIIVKGVIYAVFSGADEEL
jgi:hypothetical protein